MQRIRDLDTDVFLLICVGDVETSEDSMNLVHDALANGNLNEKIGDIVDIREPADWSQVKDSLDGSFEEWANAKRLETVGVWESVVALGQSEIAEQTHLDGPELDDDPLYLSLMDNIRKARGIMLTLFMLLM